MLAVYDSAEPSQLTAMLVAFADVMETLDGGMTLDSANAESDASASKTTVLFIMAEDYTKF